MQLQSVSKIFFTEDLETHALADVDLVVQRGEFVSISGPSGCGKSTLLAIMGLLDSPTRGRYRINGYDVTGLSLSERARLRNREVGFVFQNFNLIGDMTARENVELPLDYRGVPGRQRRGLAMDALERVGMTHRAGHFPGQLSGGQQQRVAVARAIAGGPSILLADEPTGNLDSANGAAVIELLSRLHQEGTTVCLVTHDSRHAGLADRTVRLLDGRIAGRGDLDGDGAMDLQAVRGGRGLGSPLSPESDPP